MNSIELYKSDIFRKIGIPFERGKKILDVGCGDCLDAKMFIQQYGMQTYGTDVYMHKNVRSIKGLIFKKGSIYKLPFKDNMFDYVFLNNVLHHIDEKHQRMSRHLKALHELKRVCKKKGVIIVLEANRYNPLFYPHMVLLGGHNHFTQLYFRKIFHMTFSNVMFRYFEAHVYPQLLRRLFVLYELLMEKFSFLQSFRAYNLAVINNNG